MGLIKRLHRITIGRIEAFLDRVEDPETIFPVLIGEMEDQLKTATEEEATAVAACKRSEIDVSKAREKVDDLGKGAARALETGDEDTARAALAAQIDSEKSLSLVQQNLETLTATMDLATAARKQIHEQLEELRVRKTEILTRSRVAKAREKIQKNVGSSLGSTDSILDTVARLEEHVQETELELEIQARLAGDSRINPSLEKKLSELNSNAEVEERLNALRDKVKGD